MLVVDTPCGKRVGVDTCVGNDKVRAIRGWNMRKSPFLGSPSLILPHILSDLVLLVLFHLILCCSFLSYFISSHLISSHLISSHLILSCLVFSFILFLEDMEDAGFPLDSFTHILCTHLHIDHVGFNTRKNEEGEWIPTFPNAQYIFGKIEYEHWLSETSGRQDKAADVTTNKEIFNDSVAPVMDQAELVAADAVIVEGKGKEGKISLMPTHGHTPGCCFLLSLHYC